jgi:hypothetical protein
MLVSSKWLLRTRAWIEREQGKVLGRPTVGPEKENAVRACLSQGLGLIKTAQRVGVGVSVVQRIRAQMADDETLHC